MKALNETQVEAIAMADAYANNAALPTYSQLLACLQELMGFALFDDARHDYRPQAVGVVQAQVQ